MKVKVAHIIAKDAEGRTLRPAEAVYPADYEVVAEVEIDYGEVFAIVLDAVYNTTQHINDDWCTFDAVTMLVERPCRSTSHGDVLIEEDGTKWFCDRIGWKEIK